MVTTREIQAGEDLTVAYERSWAAYDPDHPCGCSTCDPDRHLPAQRKHARDLSDADQPSQKRHHSQPPEASTSTSAAVPGKQTRRAGKNRNRRPQDVKELPEQS
jgi:hypothetical protein